MSKYGPTVDTLVSERRSAGLWQWVTCHGGSLAAATAIAAAEEAPAMIGLVVLWVGSKSCAAN